MRLILLAILGSLCVDAFAQSKSSPAITSELPKDMELQEQYLVLATKLKNVAEVQDLMLKQQQLLLENLQAVRTRLDKLEADRTNAPARPDLQGYSQRLDQLQRLIDAERETNRQMVARALQDALPKLNSPRTNPTAPIIATRLEQYRVQPGDTLSKLVLRYNDTLDRQGLPRITQEQIERANPGMEPDKIRLGQTIYLPVPEKMQ